MARYFFDGGDSNHVVEDEVGIDCAGLEEARRAGLEGLKDLARDALKDSDGQLLFIEVRDESGEKLLKLCICLQVTAMG
ncbi:hypothetical protein [Mesorhizobium sp. LNHC209A00]|uniref:DUF6894 family protein n=2 Tax=Phyllobacteriaceae TaxID=69277 RepID=UPI0003CFA953|nr:hypothetical protein [Mesorhizobium sp. LNHC209A00]ESY91931.1 hypothetical protein X738_28065 [Mesorhizobium sp. LNHC209A00]